MNLRLAFDAIAEDDMITVQGLVEHFECARVRFSDDVDIFNDVFEEE